MAREKSQILDILMKREIERVLHTWKNHPTRLPILLRGARQVGKSHLIETFGSTAFENSITINFEFQPELSRCFDTLNPMTILDNLSAITQQKIEPGKTLLFFDEIQECPNAILSLRYFKEKLPEQHVISAGSLVEFIMNDERFRMPVGRVQSLYLNPLSFKEFLLATGYQTLRERLETASLNNPLDSVLHDKLLSLVKNYMALGGMPAVLNEHIKTQNMQNTQQIQTAILASYRLDFGKYANRANHKYLQKLFEKAPGLIAQHFKYINVDPNMRSRDIKNALDMLNDAGVLQFIHATQASGIPLASLINEKKFKLLFLDIGLANRAGQLGLNVLMQEDIMLVNRGALAEQFVGQELLAYQNPFERTHLFFWQRNAKSSSAEVDFVTTIDAHIIPIEVKAGITGRLKSLQMFMQEKKSPLGVRVSQLPLSLEKGILNLPLYMISEIDKLTREVLNSSKN